MRPRKEVPQIYPLHAPLMIALDVTLPPSAYDIMFSPGRSGNSISELGRLHFRTKLKLQFRTR
jgi:hypothetical protein